MASRRRKLLHLIYYTRSEGAKCVISVAILARHFRSLLFYPYSLGSNICVTQVITVIETGERIPRGFCGLLGEKRQKKGGNGEDIQRPPRRLATCGAHTQERRGGGNGRKEGGGRAKD